MSAPKFYGSRLETMTFSATSTDSAYPLANLQTYNPLDEWRSNATTAGQALVIDLGSAQAIDFVALHAHNFDLVVADVGVKLQAADNSGFSTNLVTVVADLSAATDPRVIEFNSVTKRYWRILFDSAGALAAKPQLGQIYLGAKLTWTSEYEYGFRPMHPRYQTSEAESLSGLLRAAQSVGGRLVFEARFRLQDDTLRSVWYTFMSLVRGKLRPFYFLDADGTSLYFVKNDSDYLAPTIPQYGRSDFELIRLKTVFADY